MQVTGRLGFSLGTFRKATMDEILADSNSVQIKKIIDDVRQTVSLYIFKKLAVK